MCGGGRTPPLTTIDLGVTELPPRINNLARVNLNIRWVWKDCHFQALAHLVRQLKQPVNPRAVVPSCALRYEAHSFQRTDNVLDRCAFQVRVCAEIPHDLFAVQTLPPHLQTFTFFCENAPPWWCKARGGRGPYTIPHLPFSLFTLEMRKQSERERALIYQLSLIWNISWQQPCSV